jgi:leader peptidase (prepilin peptidase)/N-methyltransferase
MGSSTLLITVLATGAAAAILSRWTRRVAHAESVWLRRGLQVLLAAVGGAGAAALATGWAELVGFAALAVGGALLVTIDLAVHRLPDIIVTPLYLILLGALTLAAASNSDWTRLGRAAAAGGVVIAVYALLALIRSDFGLGDVKLSGLLGIFLGWLGWSNVLLGTLAGFVLNGVFAAILLLIRRANLRTAIAFGPWMVAGAVAGAAWGPAFFA